MYYVYKLRVKVFFFSFSLLLKIASRFNLQIFNYFLERRTKLIVSLKQQQTSFVFIAMYTSVGKTNLIAQDMTMARVWGKKIKQKVSFSSRVLTAPLCVIYLVSFSFGLRYQGLIIRRSAFFFGVTCCKPFKKKKR